MAVTPPQSGSQINTLLGGLNSPALNDKAIDSANAIKNLNGFGVGGDGTNAAALFQQASAVAQDNATMGGGANNNFQFGAAYFTEGSEGALVAAGTITDNYTAAVPTNLRPLFDAKAHADFNNLPPGSAATAKAFLSWSTQTQIDYLQHHPEAFPPDNQYRRGLQANIGADPNIIHVMVSANGSKVIELDNLQKTDIMKLSGADQLNVAASDVFKTRLGAQLNLLANVPDATTKQVPQQITALLGNIQLVQTTVSNATKITTDPVTGQLITTNDNANGMFPDDTKPFLQELKRLYDSVSASKVVSPTDVANALQAIKLRFDRANAFAQQKVHNFYNGTVVPTGNTADGNTVQDGYEGIVETDTAIDRNNPNPATSSNPQVLAGYKNFIAQETQIDAAQSAIANLAASPVLNNKSLDAPTLIFFFELNNTLIGQATINADTTEVQQLNNLLNAYSQMQNLVNKTIQSITDANTGRAFLNLGNWSVISDQDRNVTAMFEEQLSGNRRPQLPLTNPVTYVNTIVLHPLEALYGVARPTLHIINNGFGVFAIGDGGPGSLVAYLKDQWNSFNTSLSNAVSQLNQQSQLKLNNINDETKQKDRQFDLGNNVLSKMADMIQSIGRNVA